MTTKAEQLAAAVAAIETNANIIYSLTQEAATGADFNFVNDFQDAFGLSLKGAESLIDHNINSLIAGKLRTLANVLYVREMESVTPPSDWREWVSEGKKVEAIRSLREWAGPDKLSLKEAIDVIDTYMKTSF